ncbi:hypothetical protein CTI12_AA276330 [Artemisia annua]|uniref:Legumain prodomain domain-containing protein n=1 Tax=Artemisia annua TaxID=35608 RepID=A0A2U1NDS4_ARTAN|nr:hypothetical protein CTI12_AA276330 [Artemisia annua]
MRTTSTLLMPFLLVMVILLANVRAHTSSHHKPENDTTWELLQAIANRIPSHNTEIKERDLALHRLWETYHKSTTSERPKIVKDLNKALTHMEYVNSKIEMAGLILFGPEKARSTLHSVRAPELFSLKLALFEKYCCLIPELGPRHIWAFVNICNYVADKATIKEALIVSCLMTKTEIYGLHVGNPSVQATPAPVPGSPDNYCARIYVNGTSRLKLGSYAKPYRVSLAVSRDVHHALHDKVQICFHRDASLGLCECGNDEWRSLQNGTWSSLMSPYDTSYVDVKYTSTIYDSVTVTLDQVSQGWRYVLLAVGIFMLLLALVVCRYLDFDGVKSLFIEWVMIVIALTCIFEAFAIPFQSSIDTPLAIVAVLICWASYLEAKDF